MREALGEIKLPEIRKVVKGHLPSDARVGETESYVGALGANTVERLWGSLPVPTHAFSAFMTK